MDKLVERYVHIGKNIAEFFKVMDDKPYLMGYLFIDAYKKEELCDLVNKWNRGEEIELLT